MSGDLQLSTADEQQRADFGILHLQIFPVIARAFQEVREIPESRQCGGTHPAQKAEVSGGVNDRKVVQSLKEVVAEQRGMRGVMVQNGDRDDGCHGQRRMSQVTTLFPEDPPMRGRPDPVGRRLQRLFVLRGDLSMHVVPQRCRTPSLVSEVKYAAINGTH